MKFNHPEEIMLAKMLGLTPRCLNCTYFKGSPPWCEVRQSGLDPGTRFEGRIICPDFIVRRPA